METIAPQATPFSQPLLTAEEVEQLNRTLEAICRDFGQKLQDAATAIARAVEPDFARMRVTWMMPDLSMRQTMVHGYVRYEET